MKKAALPTDVPADRDRESTASEAEPTDTRASPLEDDEADDITDPEAEPLLDDVEAGLDPVSAEEILAAAEAADGPEAGEPGPPKMELHHEVVPPLVEDEEELVDEVEEDQPEIPLEGFDPDAVKVVRRLRQHGFEAYFVGGCVRDLLLGKEPKDFDVATSAEPDDVRDIFRNCRLIGRRFRLAHVYFKGGKIVEVATFRANPAELEAEAGAASGEGAPSDVFITSDNVFGTAEEDARRRDFTINGLFYDIGSGKVLDFVRGRRDVDERYIRTIGNAETRMREDPVRLLRAVRFACKLGLDLESRTYAAMEGAVEDLPRCSAPRLLEETFRLLRSGSATGSLKLLGALDAMKLLLRPVHDCLRKADEAAVTSFWAHTEAMDARVRAGQVLEDAILLAVLLIPVANAEPETDEEGARPTTAQAIEDLLSDMVRDARLPRRIAERTRMILISQRTLSGQRRRRGSLASFRRHPLFNESLTVFELSVQATGENTEALEKWKAGETPEVRTDAAAADGPKKKRRRRRRPRRAGGSGGEGSSEEGGSEGGDDSAEASAD